MGNQTPPIRPLRSRPDYSAPGKLWTNQSSEITLTVLVLLLFAISVSHSREKDKHFGKFGDLHVTTTELESFECASHRGDHHHVAVFVKVENAGKGVICII